MSLVSSSSFQRNLHALNNFMLQNLRRLHRMSSASPPSSISSNSTPYIDLVDDPAKWWSPGYVLMPAALDGHDIIYRTSFSGLSLSTRFHPLVLSICVDVLLRVVSVVPVDVSLSNMGTWGILTPLCGFCELRVLIVVQRRPLERLLRLLTWRSVHDEHPARHNRGSQRWHEPSNSAAPSR